MESPNLSSLSSSNLSISSEKEKVKERNPFSSSRSTWKSRYDCIQAYLCVLMSFGHGLQLGASIGKYGLIILIPYAVCTILVGFPAVLVEVIMSRYVMGDMAKVWNMCPLVNGIKWCLIGTTMIAVSINYMYIVYLIKYFFWTITDAGNWRTCNGYWNNYNCYRVGKKTEAFSNCLKNNTEKFCRSLDWETSGTQFWKYKISDKLSVSEDIWFIVSLMVSICITIVIIFKEIRSLEKILMILVAFPIVLGTILACVAFSIPEALLGFRSICSFNWEWLLNLQIWIEGLEDTLLLLGLTDLSLTFVSSHGGFADDIFVDVVVIIFGGFFVSLFLTIPILCVGAGSRGKLPIVEPIYKQLFKDKEDVFISISDALIVFPFPNNLWSTLTYLNWLLIAIGAQAVMILSICDIFVGMTNFEFFNVLSVYLISSFFTVICLMFFDFGFIIDIKSLALTVIFLFTITWQFFYGIGKFNYDFFFMMGYSLPLYVKCSWFTLLGGTLVGVILKIYAGIPDKPLKYIFYGYVGIPFFIYIITSITEIAELQVKKEKIFQLFTANPNWGPENVLLKKSRFILASGNVNREFMYRQELNKKPYKKPPDFSEQNIVQLI